MYILSIVGDLKVGKPANGTNRKKLGTNVPHYM